MTIFLTLFYFCSIFGIGNPFPYVAYFEFTMPLVPLQTLHTINQQYGKCPSPFAGSNLKPLALNTKC
jgi:hypothetical protein